MLPITCILLEREEFEALACSVGFNRWSTFLTNILDQLGPGGKVFWLAFQRGVAANMSVENRCERCLPRRRGRNGPPAPRRDGGTRGGSRADRWRLRLLGVHDTSPHDA